MSVWINLSIKKIFAWIALYFSLAACTRFVDTGGYIDGLMQDCSNFIANTLELLQYCTEPSILDFNIQLCWDGRRLYHASMEKLINIKKITTHYPEYRPGGFFIVLQSAKKFRKCLERLSGICNKDVGFIKYFTYIHRWVFANDKCITKMHISHNVIC